MGSEASGTQAYEGCSDPSFVGVTTCEFCHADEGGICFRIADKNYPKYKSAPEASGATTDPTKNQCPAKNNFKK